MEVRMVSVSDLMTDVVMTLRPADTLNDARLLMKMAKIRHTPITDGAGNFEGLITNRDLLACTISRLAGIDETVQTEIDTAIQVSDIMQRDVVCVGPDTPLREAARLLYEHKYGCLPVLRGRKLVGILTESDFLRLAMSLLEG